MTRQIIDIGANANDGTGEPLRDAFQAVNDNFANVWAAGPVDSQVIISNNVISTNVDNLDLVLAGNGIGNVTMESTVVPMIDSVYDLGSTDRKFDSVYARYFYGNGRYLTGISGGGSNVYFSTNAPVNPNIGDVWIQSDTAVQYLYFNDNTSNQWAEMEAYQSFSSGGGTGNVDLTSVTSDIIPQASLAYSIGNVTNQWSNVYADSIYSNNYLYANGNPISSAPAGSNTQIQFNNQGNLGASANLVYNSDVNQLQLDGGFRINGTISTPGQANIVMAVYGSWGGGNNYEWVFDNLGRLVLPTVSNPENGTILANSANLTVKNELGNVVIASNADAWLFAPNGSLELPPANVESTPSNPGFANQTQKTISGSIDTVAGNPLPSYTTSLSQTETIWTATNVNVTSAKMTLRVQYGVGPVVGMEMCDVVVAKEWGTNANVSYVISNRIRTNNSLGYANVVATLDGSNNLIVTVTNTSGLSEYYSYSATEFNVTND